jgi:hypothetical protein
LAEGNITNDQARILSDMTDEIMQNLDLSVNQDMVPTLDGYELAANPNDVFGITMPADSTISGSALYKTLDKTGGDATQLSQPGISLNAQQNSEIPANPGQHVPQTQNFADMLNRVDSAINQQHTKMFPPMNNTPNTGLRSSQVNAIYQQGPIPTPVHDGLNLPDMRFPPPLNPMAPMSNPPLVPTPPVAYPPMDPNLLASQSYVAPPTQVGTAPIFNNRGYEAQNACGGRNKIPRNSTPHKNVDFQSSEDGDSVDERANMRLTQQAIRSMPRSLYFDGQGHWVTFKRKFLHYIRAFDLSEADSLFCLIHCLSGSAGQLFAALDEGRGIVSFADLMETLDQTYGNLQTDNMAEREFEMASQTKDESLQMWADRIQRLGCQAFKNLPRSYEKRKVVSKFCSGLGNGKMGYDIIMREPQSLPDALRLAMISDTTFKNVVRKEKVSFAKARYAQPEYEPSSCDSDTEQESGDEYSVRQVSKSVRPNPKFKKQPPPNFNKPPRTPRTQQTPKTPQTSQTPQPSDTEKIIAEFLGFLKQLNLVPAKPDSSAAPVSQPQPSTIKPQTEEPTQYRCFHCDDPTHFKNKCPKLHPELNK